MPVVAHRIASGRRFGAVVQYRDEMATPGLVHISNEPRYTASITATRPVSKPVDLSWLFKAIACGREECSKEALTTLISGLSDLLLNKSYDVVDLILRSVLNFHLSPEALLAMARTSFAARQSLREWTTFVAAMKDEFRVRGLDVNRLAQGLG